MTVTEFESFVFAQQPAVKPWEPVTPYDCASRTAIEGQHPALIRDVLRPQSVLDYGCGPDACLLRLLRELGVDVVGWDVPAHVAHLAPQERGRLDRRYDLVICREVLEHCTVLQIRQMVSELCRLSSRLVYVTTRYHPNPLSLLDVATADVLDPTHISLCNKDLLRVLFVLEGFKCRADLEAQMDHQHKRRVLVYERTSRE